MQKTILLVDDDEDEVDIVKMALEMVKVDCRCIWASGLEHALELIKHHKPDFVFIDINMPRHDGLSCLKKLRQSESLHHSVFVMYSTYISDDDREAAIQSGASFCMHKPENINMLQDQLKILFSRNTRYS